MPSEPTPPTERAPTLACLLTPRGEGGISVIEISGSDAVKILDRLFLSPRDLRAAQMTPGRLAYGKLWREGEFLDEVILDCVELEPRPTFAVNCHGGAVAAGRVLRALEAEGAKSADWPELFSLQQQESGTDRIRMEVAERIPSAPMLLAAGVLLDQYHGALSGALNSIRREILSEPDWPSAESMLERLLATARFGRGLCEPARVVIAGRPNVGKSTLANALLRFDRVIVHAVPGTTRDTIEQTFAIRGVPFLLVDTAGIREARCAIEEEGVQRGKEEIRRANVVIIVFDGSIPLQEEDRPFLAAGLPPGAVPVINKCDLPRVLPADEIKEKTGRAPVETAATQNTGIEALEERILETACPCRPAKGDAVIFTARQERNILAALLAVKAHDSAEAIGFIHRVLSDG